MVSRSNRVCLFLAVGVLATILANAGQAEGGSTKGVAIIGTGGPVSGTDPLFFYDFKVYVTDGFSLWNNDYFTFLSLPGVQPGAKTVVTSPYSFGNPIITPDPQGSMTSSDVEWQYTGAPPNIVGGNVLGQPGTFVGEFVIYTNVSMNSLPSTVLYDAQSHHTVSHQIYIQNGPSGNQGVIPLAVPEPSSVTLLLLGSSVLPLRWLYKRRRGSVVIPE